MNRRKHKTYGMALSLQPTSNTNPSSRKVPGSVQSVGFRVTTWLELLILYLAAMMVGWRREIIRPPPEGWGEDKMYIQECIQNAQHKYSQGQSGLLVQQHKYPQRVRFAIFLHVAR